MAGFVRRWAATALITAIACVTSSAQSVHGPEGDLAKIEDEWIQARLKGDVTYLERLYAPELRITGADGSVIRGILILRVSPRARSSRNRWSAKTCGSPFTATQPSSSAATT